MEQTVEFPVSFMNQHSYHVIVMPCSLSHIELTKERLQLTRFIIVAVYSE